MGRLAWLAGLIITLVSVAVLKPREEIIALMTAWAMILGLAVMVRCLFSTKKWKQRLKFYGLAMAEMVVFALWFGWGMYISDHLPSAFPWDSLPVLMKAVVFVLGVFVGVVFIFTSVAMAFTHICLLGESLDSSDPSG